MADAKPGARESYGDAMRVLAELADALDAEAEAERQKGNPILMRFFGGKKTTGEQKAIAYRHALAALAKSQGGAP